MKYVLISIILLFVLTACDEPAQIQPESCPSDFSFDVQRNFLMGFSTWPFGPDVQDIKDTYSFIAEHSDIYAEQIDDKIPWTSLIQTNQLPDKFASDLSNKIRLDTNRLLSTTPLNSGRDTIAEELDGSQPAYALNSDEIKQAYTQWVRILINEFNPDYLIIGMEINELYINSPELWPQYVELISFTKTVLSEEYPNLPISESMTIHNLLSNRDNTPYISAMKEHATNIDYFSASYYPFFVGHTTKVDYQSAFDFVHNFTSLPIAFSETTHIAQNLNVPLLLLNIKSDQCQQNEFLEVLFENAQKQNYEYVIFWTHKDYDELWETFPIMVKDLGKIWRDTGLIDENNVKRESYYTWMKVYSFTSK